MFSCKNTEWGMIEFFIFLKKKKEKKKRLNNVFCVEIRRFSFLYFLSFLRERKRKVRTWTTYNTQCNKRHKTYNMVLYNTNWGMNLFLFCENRSWTYILKKLENKGIVVWKTFVDSWSFRTIWVWIYEENSIRILKLAVRPSKAFICKR